MQNGWRTRRYWDWAKENANLFHGILPEHVCEAALATCRITLQGPKSVGETAKNWGQWIRMRMQTFGHVPHQIATAVQQHYHWISTDSYEAVDVILDCFDLTLDDVFDHYGEPREGETRTLDLCEIVTTVAPWAAIKPDYTVEPESVVAVA